MKKVLLFISALHFALGISGQENINKSIDSLYREDQFYIGVTYNLLGNRPENVSQTGFSSGLHFGFIRDMPINKARNISIGLGLGYSTNSFNQNLFISKDEVGTITYSILNDSETYSKNKFSTHLVELPFEFRWRTSTPESYNFWRIYTGFKIGYAFRQTTKFKGDLGNIKQTNISDFNEIQYGFTLSAGYNTWNVYLYYPFNSIFTNEAKLNGSNLDINVIKIGLMFYIL